MIGTVIAFDEAGGYGTVRSDRGADHFFHCSAIADGTRTIEVGVDVRFEVVPGRRGEWEAAHVTETAPEVQSEA